MECLRLWTGLSFFVGTETKFKEKMLDGSSLQTVSHWVKILISYISLSILVEKLSIYLYVLC